MATNKLRVALIGAGGIAAAHINGALAHPTKLEYVALCDVSAKNLETRKAQLGTNPALFSDWKTMLADFGDQFEAVDICLPHHLHTQAILDSVAAGKHVLCEKPLCIDLAEADQIVDVVQRSGLVFMPGHNQLFMPVVREARKLIDSGAIGEVRWLRSMDCFVNSWLGNDSWRFHKKEQGGGEFIDTGYHPTYRLMFLAGSEFVGVRASMNRYLLPMEGEDSGSVQVRFANGAIGEILSSWAYPLPFGSHQIHVIGDKGQIFGSGDNLYYLPAGYKEPAHRVLPGGVDTFAAQAEYFSRCVLTGERPLHSVEESRTVLQIILGAYADAAGCEQYAVKKLV